MKFEALTFSALFALSLAASPALAQSSSLFVRTDTPAAPASPRLVDGRPDRLSPELARTSLTAVRMPEPKKFAVQDLITIVVREDTEAESDTTLNTKKDTQYNGQLDAFPHLKGVSDLMGFIGLNVNDINSGKAAKLGMNYKNDYKADGSYSRKDTMTTRVTARIIDVKPNGTLVLEARKFTKSDNETLSLVLTGTCRKDDVASDNTVLSTQLYDLNLRKEHTGALRDASKKGIVSKLLNGLFAF